MRKGVFIDRRSRGSVVAYCYKHDTSFVYTAYSRSTGGHWFRWVFDSFSDPLVGCDLHGVRMSAILKKALQKQEGAGLSGQASDPAFAKLYPVLVEFLCCRQLDKDTKRETSTLNVFTEGGSWKAFLNDRDNQMSLCVSADTFTGLLEALEATVSSDHPGWRPLPPRNGQARGKKT